MSTTRRTLGVYASPAPRGPDGKKLCRNCHAPLPDGRKHNCSPACSEAWSARTSPSYMRYLVWKRDQGICARCKTDSVAGQFNANGSPRRNSATGTGDLWQADHIIPVIEGGGECDLSNLRTLCTKCHKAVTRELHERLKQARIDKARQLTAQPRFGDSSHIAAKKYLKRQGLKAKDDNVETPGALFE